MITSASPEWVLLSAVYYHVLGSSPSPDRAQMNIAAAQLHLRAVIRIEHHAGPRGPSGKVLKDEMILTFNQPVPHNGWDEWDWERSFAVRYDSATKSAFEYVAIVSTRDDVLKLWPSGPTQKPPDENAKQTTRWQRDRAANALKELFPPDGVVPVGLSSGRLCQMVSDHLKPQSKRLGSPVPKRTTILRAAGRTMK
jgi:hypothetical protein